MAATALADQDSHRKDFQALIARRSEPDSVLARRRQALERYTSLGLPTTRQEAWRFTDVGVLTQTEFKRAGDTPVDATALPVLEGPHHRLVFVNGRFAPGLSRLKALPAKALIGSLEQALLTHPEQLEAHLDRVPGLDDHPFMARTSAFWEDGAFVYLPRGVVLEAPLHLVFLATGEDTVNHPRALIVLEDTAQATIVEDYRGAGRYLSCPLTEIVAGTGAHVQFHRIQREDRTAWHVGGLRLRQNRDSRFQACLFSSGGLLARTDVAVLLDGEGAECELAGLTLVADHQLGDCHVRVEHAQARCRSQQLFKGVLDDKARAVFDGLIHVRQDAQKTDASQTNQNLLLSKQALANSNPRLEILADDVKCGHGSSIGFLDADALFYLRSRGIDEAEAKAMLVYAFANDVVERIQLASLRKRLEEVLARRLYPAAAERNPA